MNRRKFLVRVLWLLLVPMIQVPTIQAETRRQASLCLGFNPQDATWGFSGVLADNDPGSVCPENFAFLSIQDSYGARREGAFIPVKGVCCQLPEDVLLDKHFWVEEECPQDSVATGGKPARIFENQTQCSDYMADQGFMRKLSLWFGQRDVCAVAWEYVPQYMRCTAINTEKYRLADSRPAYALGWDRSLRTWNDPRTTRAAIPVGLRYAIGRRSKKRWKRSACVGVPWGSLFVQKESKYCSGLKTRQLLHRSNNQAVLRYEQCLAVEDPLSEDPHCRGSISQ